MNPQYINNNRISHWLIPLFCIFMGTNSNGIANSDMQSFNLEVNTVLATHEIDQNNEDQSGLNGYVPGAAHILDMILKSLSNVLDDPTLEGAVIENHGDSINENADLLILGYPMFGLDPNLSYSEVEIGLDDAYILIDILKHEPELVNLDEDTQFELRETAEAIIEELENGE